MRIYLISEIAMHEKNKGSKKSISHENKLWPLKSKSQWNQTISNESDLLKLVDSEDCKWFMKTYEPKSAILGILELLMSFNLWEHCIGSKTDIQKWDV